MRLLVLTACLLCMAEARRSRKRPIVPVSDNCGHVSVLQGSEKVLVPRTPMKSELDICRPADQDGTERKHCCNRFVERSMRESAQEDFHQHVWLSSFQELDKKLEFLGKRVRDDVISVTEPFIFGVHKHLAEYTKDKAENFRHGVLLSAHFLLQALTNTVLQVDQDEIHNFEIKDSTVEFQPYKYLESDDCRLEFWRLASSNNVKAVQGVSRLRLLSAIHITSGKLSNIIKALKRYELRDSCINATVRMLRCSMCDYRSLSSPCRSMCHNVAASCWYPVVSLLDAPLRQIRNHVYYMHEKAGTLMDILDDFTGDVKRLLDHVKLVDESVKDNLQIIPYCAALFTGEKSNSSFKDLPEFPTEFGNHLDFENNLKELVTEIGTSHSNLHKVPQSLCKHIRGQRRSIKDKCWDGDSIVESYNKPESFELKADVQEVNVEAPVNTSLYSHYIYKIKEDLDALNKILTDLIKKPTNLVDFEFSSMLRYLVSPLVLPLEEKLMPVAKGARKPTTTTTTTPSTTTSATPQSVSKAKSIDDGKLPPLDSSSDLEKQSPAEEQTTRRVDANPGEVEEKSTKIVMTTGDYKVHAVTKPSSSAAQRFSLVLLFVAVVHSLS